MKIYEAFNWIKDADYTPHGFLIFNENTPEGQLKGEALKTIFEAAKNGELVTLEMFEAVKKERNEAVKRRNELLKEKNSQISDELTNKIIEARKRMCEEFCRYIHEKHHGKLTQETLEEICDLDCPLSKL